jgi:hypothetical protein
VISYCLPKNFLTIPRPRSSYVSIRRYILSRHEKTQTHPPLEVVVVNVGTSGILCLIYRRRVKEVVHRATTAVSHEIICNCTHVLLHDGTRFPYHNVCEDGRPSLWALHERPQDGLLLSRPRSAVSCIDRICRGRTHLDMIGTPSRKRKSHLMTFQLQSSHSSYHMNDPDGIVLAQKCIKNITLGDSYAYASINAQPTNPLSPRRRC